MARQGSLTVRVNLKVVLVVLAIAVPLILFDMFWVLQEGRESLDTAIRAQFETIAKVAASESSRWVHGRISLLGVVAANPEIRRVVANSNAAYQGHSDSFIAARLSEVDKSWQTPQATSIAARMLANPASDFLKEFVSIAPNFKRLLVTDNRGASVAGSHKSIDYAQADEDWWVRSFGDGVTGRIYVEDVRHDPVTRTHFIGINLPILDAREERVIGVLRAVVDVAELSPVTGQIRFGNSGEAVLVNSQGNVISASRMEFSPDRKSEEYEEIRGQPTFARQASGAEPVSLRGGARNFVGYAKVGLAQAFPNLEWTMIVRQDYNEATAPIETINNRILLSGFAAIFLVAILAVYFSLHSPTERTGMEDSTPP